MKDKLLKVGIIGLGHLHPVQYMPHFAKCPHTAVVAASDHNGQLGKEFAERFGIKLYSDWKDMITKEEIDLAYIFLPHCDCADAAVACAKLKIHVVVEKPVANSSSNASRAVKACRDNKVLFSTPYLWRLHPVTRKMKEFVKSGVLGKIVGCEGRCAAGGLHRYIEGHSEWMLDRKKSGGGPMYNLGVHWIDLYRWLLEDEIVEVVGKNVRVGKEHNIEDNSFAIATFGSGTTLSLDISYTVPDSYPFGRDLYLGLRGTEGCINFAPSFEGLRQTMFVCSNNPKFGGAPRQTINFELENVPGYSGSCGLEYVSQIAGSIIGRSEPPVSGDDAVRALRVVEAIYESDKSGKSIKVKYD